MAETLEAKSRLFFKERRSCPHATQLAVSGLEEFEGEEMNLEIWLPGLFALGLVGMGLCYAFMIACEKI